jgi:hypothetical protein
MATPFSSKELQVISTQLDHDHSSQGVELCNRIFGFNNWSSEIRELRLYFTAEEMSTDGKVSYSSGASAISRVVLRDGSHRDAVGSGDCSGVDTKMKSIEIAQQAAINEGMRRCVEQFQAGRSHSAHPMLLTTQGSSLHTLKTNEVSSVSTHGHSTLPSSSSPSTTTAHLSGHKRVLQQHNEQFTEMRPHTPSVNFSYPPQSTITSSPDVHSSASPTMEDIDSLMQQYDQVDKGVNSTLKSASTTTQAVAKTKISNPARDEESVGRGASAYLKEAYPTHATSLKGQKYPPKPNLQDPFGK